MTTDTRLFNRLSNVLPKWDNAFAVIPQSQHAVLDVNGGNDKDPNIHYVSKMQSLEDAEEQEETLEKYFKQYSSELEYLEQQGFVNLTKLAFWKASSFKVGNPIANAIDDDPTTFWQSDGVQPHKIDISFSKRVDVVQLALYFCLITDESYTPELIKIYAGFSKSDASLYRTLEIKNVNGWVIITFKGNRPQDDLLRCRFIQIQILSNHENGKDSHLRGIRIFGNSATQKKTINAGNQALEMLIQSSAITNESIR